MNEQALFAKYSGTQVDTCDVIFQATFPEKDVSEYNLTIAELEVFIHNIKEYANSLIATAVEIAGDKFNSRADELKQREWIKTDVETDDKPSKIPPESTPTAEKTPTEPTIIADPVVSTEQAQNRCGVWGGKNSEIIRDWAAKEIPGQPYMFPRYAAAHGMVDVLDDYSQFITLPADLYQQAIYYDQLEVVEWLYNRQLFDIVAAEQYAASRGKLAILKYLIGKRHTTTNFDLICEHAASAGQIAVLQMLAIRYAWPVKWRAMKDIAAQNEQHELVAWIDQMCR